MKSTPLRTRLFLSSALSGIALAYAVQTAPAFAQTIIDNGDVVIVPGDRPNPWILNNGLFVGHSGNGSLIIENGGVVSINSDPIFGGNRIGNQAGSDGSVTVSGDGSRWDNTAPISVGNFGKGTLTVTDGGVVTSLDGFVAQQPGAEGTVLVTGDGSQWNVERFLVVGAYAQGAMTIENGGIVTSRYGTLGESVGRNNIGAGTVTVTGDKSRWDVTNGLLVGSKGTGSLIIEEQGRVRSGNAIVGHINDSRGEVRVSGVGSRWDIYGSPPFSDDGLIVGRHGTGTLTIEDGGVVSNINGTIGQTISASSSVTVSGDGSRWENSGDATVGDSGTGILIVEDRGVVTSTNGIVGNTFNGTGVVEISGEGSQWTSTDTLTIGNAGDGTLTIKEEGMVALHRGFIANERGSAGRVIVSGAGSRLDATSNLLVGLGGHGTLAIENGGVVTNVDAFLAMQDDATGMVRVSGPGSHWDLSRTLHVGLRGSGTLTVVNGGLVTNLDGLIDTQPGTSNTSSVIVTGAGSHWLNRRSLIVGNDGVGGLTVSEAGLVSAETIHIASKDTGTGAVNIGAAEGEAATAPGTLDTETIVFGDGSGTLNFNHTETAYEFAPNMSGFGQINHLAGTTIITGDSSAFTGMTDLTGGELRVIGVLGGDTTTAAGTLLTGTGTLGGDLTINGGTVSPGVNGLGTINIAGNLTFNEGSIFAIDVVPNGGSDVLAVTGTTEISNDGTIINVIGGPADFPTTQIFTVVTSDGGVTGEFAGVTDDLPDVDLVAIYNPDSVQLTYVRTPSGTEIGGPDENGDPDNPSSDQPLSRKEVHPSAQAAAMDSALLFAQTLRRRGGLYAGADGNSSTSTADLLLPASGPYEDDQVVGPTPHDWAIWGAGMGRLTNVDSSGGVYGYDVRVGGVAVGVERHFDAMQARFGLAGGYSTTDVDNGPSDADVETWHVGAYGSAATGSLILSGAIAYAWQDYDFDRYLPFGGGAVMALGNTDGTTLTASGEAFYDLAYHLGMSDLGGVNTGSADGLRFGPLATIDAVQATRNGFTETGAGILNLTVGSETASQAITGLGIAVGTVQTFGAMRLSADARVTWEHVFGDTAVIATSAIPIASATFLASSAETDRDRVAVGLGAALDVSDRISAHMRYDAFLSQTTDDHSGSAGLTFRF